MITLAEKLSSQFPFVRVDFYYVNNKIYFGELTLTPNNGMESINPIERDMEIAGWIDIKKYKQYYQNRREFNLVDGKVIILKDMKLNKKKWY